MKSNEILITLFVISLSIYPVDSLTVKSISNKIPDSNISSQSNLQGKALILPSLPEEVNPKFLSITCNKLNCKECTPSAYRFQKVCTHVCPPGTYKDEPSGTCYDCNPNCPVCWAGEASTCGTKSDLFVRVVELKDEIQTYFNTNSFSKDTIEKWIAKLKYVIRELFNNNGTKNDEKIITPTVNYVEGMQISTLNSERLTNILSIKGSRDTTYNNFKEVAVKAVYPPAVNELVELPIGSFSVKNGILIPVPGFVDSKGITQKSRWFFKEGCWDGYNWNDKWSPRLPSYISAKGKKDKIYHENNYYWYYDHSKKQWQSIESKQHTANARLSGISKEEIELLMSNSKIEVGDYNRKMISQSLEQKRSSMKGEIKQFFNRFFDTNSRLFDQFRTVITEQQANATKNLEDLKGKIDQYLNPNKKIGS